MGDYEKTVRIAAAPDRVLTALTTTEGITAWWNRATGSGQQGGELVIEFDPPMLMRVDEASPSAVRWSVLDCPVERDWDGTAPTFSLLPTDDGTDVTFRHVGLVEALECHDVCSRSWDHFLDSLQRYVETDHGMPSGSTEDLARRSA